ncbi:MAG TPA: hypothetical protein VFD44_03175 [Hanamia sp.]|nr:hypothetical protein [Hanamia sp.]
MKFLLKYLFTVVLLTGLSCTVSKTFAQRDTAKGGQTFLGKVINNFKKDSTEIDYAAQLKTNEAAFVPFEGLIIRNIVIERIPFGFSIGDTSRRLINSLTKLANDLHHITKTRVVKKNLFFKEGDSLRPYLMADNERFLRQLLYLQDAQFFVTRTAPGSDSVDVFVEVKDVFSLGGAINSLGLKQSSIEFREDNFAGSGNAAIAYTLYDDKRKNDFAFGGEYNSRNVGGSFMDARIGYQSFYPAITGVKEDNNYYIDLHKPLVNRYMSWTYELSAAYHATTNLYNKDSVYFSDVHYRYYNIEAWAGYNVGAKDYSEEEEATKLRKLIGIRYLDQKFLDVPGKYESVYDWKYPTINAALASVTFYRQNFYKTKYIYGFGRNEDIPEGLLLTLTAGYTERQNAKRPFIGFDFEKYHFNKQENYISYKIAAEGYLRASAIEDLNFMGSLFYFDHLKSVGKKWKQRFFLNFDLAQQVNTVFNQPLFANSQFGLPEYGNEIINNERVGGALRSTGKVESEFFSPWSVVAFRFAPFVFTDVSVFSPYSYQTKVLSSIGGGIRTRNESLIFGTIELRTYYFPQKNFYNERFRFSLSTNVIFKYNNQFVKKPDFIQIN